VDFDEAAQYLHGLTRLGIKLGNERFEALLERLGNPHLRLRAIHIAGTKGKGSTAMFASAILLAEGYKVGTYLSPYVYDLRERVQIDGEMISRDDMARLATRIRTASEQLLADNPDLGPTTEFEFKTALGFCHFADELVDYAVVEVGLGGRLDATNVLRDPIVSVITNIGFDHMHLLGETLDKIAGEKAGIVKRGGVCVSGAQAPEAAARIAAVCKAQNATFVQLRPGVDWVAEDDNLLSIYTPRRTMTGIHLGVRGEFQIANAAVAVHALDRARETIPIRDWSIRTGLSGARMPGRLEIVRTDGPTVVVDAAHNEMAAEALSAALKSVFRADSRPMVFVIGMSKGHEPVEFLRSLISGFDPLGVTLIATEPPFRPREAEDVAMAARDVGVRRVEVVTPVVAAASRAIDAALELGEDTMIVVTGSFFTIGELTARRWQENFEAHGLNVHIPADILEIEDQVSLCSRIKEI